MCGGFGASPGRAFLMTEDFGMLGLLGGCEVAHQILGLFGVLFFRSHLTFFFQWTVSLEPQPQPHIRFQLIGVLPLPTQRSTGGVILGDAPAGWSGAGCG